VGNVVHEKRVASERWNMRESNLFFTKPIENRDVSTRIGLPDSKVYSVFFQMPKTSDYFNPQRANPKEQGIGV